MPLSLEQFASQVSAGGLLSAADVDELRAKSNPPDAEAFARELVKQKKLTPFQAQQCFAGKGKSLVLGNYIVLDKLGQGGMGLVLKARHKRMKRIVAIKVLAPNVAKDKTLIARFQREVEAAARLTHPNIVAAYDADEAAGTVFLVMEFVEGQDLSSLVRKTGPLPVDQGVRCILQAAKGLEYAHKHGVIHRDIKPANLLLDKDGTVKILDMGLARIEGETGEKAELTSTGAVMGTVDYMAPEQALSTKHADARSDIYSLGIALWYLLAGKPAFDGDSLMARLLAHREAPIPSLSAIVDARGKPTRDTVASAANLSHVTGPGIDAVFRKMVAKRPEERYQTMTQVVAALEACLSGTAPSEATHAAVRGDSGHGGDHNLSAFLSNLRGDSGMTGAATVATSAPTKPLPATSQFEHTQTTSDSDVPTDPQTLTSLPSPVGAPRAAARPSRAADWRRDRRWQWGAGGVAAVVLLAMILLRGGAPEPVDDTTVSADSAPSAMTPSVQVTRDERPTGLASAPGVDGNVPGFGLQFDGVDDYAVVDSLNLADYPPEQPLTIEATLRPTSPRIGNALSWLGANWIALYTMDGLWGLGRLLESPYLVHGAETTPIGQTVRVAGVWDNRQWTLYIDGQRQELRPVHFDIVPTAGGLYLGGVPRDKLTGHTDGRWFRGEIDEVRLSKSARYSGASYETIDRFTPDPDTIALYHCDEGNGDQFVDASGQGHHGRIHGATWRAAATAVGPRSAPPAIRVPFALQFDGVDDYVELGPGWQYDGGELTCEAWVVPASVPDSGSNNLFSIEHGDNATRHSLRFMRRRDPKPDGSVGRKWHLSAPPSSTVGLADDPLVPGQRAHMAAVRAGSELRVFVNGKRMQLWDFQYQFKPRDVPAYAWLGAMAFSHSALNGFQAKDGWAGQIQQVRLSSRALYSQDFTPPQQLTADAQTIAFYKFDEGTGDILHDRSGHGRDGRIVGAKWTRSGEPTETVPGTERPPEFGWSPADERQTAAWVLEQRGSVSVQPLNGAGDWITLKPGDQLPPGEFTIRSIDLRDGQVQTDADCARLTRSRYVEQLNVTNADFSLESLSLLRNLPQLKSLGLAGHQRLKSSQLAALADVPSLAYLDITAEMVDDQLAFARQLGPLSRINVYGPKPPDVSGIAGATNLRSVLLTTPDAVDESRLISLQEQHPNLRIIVGWQGQYRIIGRDAAQDAALSLLQSGVAIAGGKNYWQSPGQLLQATDLRPGNVWSFDVRSLPAAAQLTDQQLDQLRLLDAYHLRIEGQAQADRIAEVLSAKRGMASLTLVRCGLTDAGAAHLQRLMGLRHLVLEGTQLTRDAVERLHQALPQTLISSDFGVYKEDFRRPNAATAVHPTSNPNYALDLSKNGDETPPHVQLPMLMKLTDPFTVECRVTPRSTALPREHRNIWHNRGRWEVKQYGDRWMWCANGTDASKANIVKSEAIVVPDRITQLAGVFTGTELLLFVDGKLSGRTGFSAQFADDALRPFLGQGPKFDPRTPEEGGYSCFDGLIDEVRLSTTARYTADYTPQPDLTVDADTLALYHCDEAEGNLLRDASRSHHGQVVNAKWVAVPVAPGAPGSDTTGTQVVPLIPFLQAKRLATGTWSNVRVQGEVVTFDDSAKLGQMWHDFPHLEGTELAIRTGVRIATPVRGGYTKLVLLNGRDPDVYVILSDESGAPTVGLRDSNDQWLQEPVAWPKPLDEFVEVELRMRAGRLQARLDGREIADVPFVPSGPYTVALNSGGWACEFRSPAVVYPAGSEAGTVEQSPR